MNKKNKLYVIDSYLITQTIHLLIYSLVNKIEFSLVYVLLEC